MPDPPKEILDRLQQWEDELPRYIKLDADKWTKDEFERAGIPTSQEGLQNGVVQSDQGSVDGAPE
jgi:hypothetical protein